MVACFHIGMQRAFLPFYYFLLFILLPSSAHVPFFRRHIGRIKRNFSKYRGGSSSANETSIDNRDQDDLPVIVSTSVGSAFLDKKKRLTVPLNATVAELKVSLQQKFPGSPPKGLQRLYFGVRLLNDTEMIKNLTTISPVPILLDMLTGTSVYNKSMSISQAIEAYSSILAQQAYIGDKIRSVFSCTIEGGKSSMETSIYRDVYEVSKQNVYTLFEIDIMEALEEEKEPDILALDTEAWRTSKVAGKNPLRIALAKEFDLNGRGLKSFLYYSVLLGVDKCILFCVYDLI